MNLNGHPKQGSPKKIPGIYYERQDPGRYILAIFLLWVPYAESVVHSEQLPDSTFQGPITFGFLKQAQQGSRSLHSLGMVWTMSS